MKCKTCIHSKVCRLGNAEFWTSGQEYDLIKDCNEYVSGELVTKSKKVAHRTKYIGDPSVGDVKTILASHLALDMVDGIDFSVNKDETWFTLCGTITYIKLADGGINTNEM